MRILVTNDDGVESPGILALAAALAAAGHDAARGRARAANPAAAGASIGPLHRSGPIPVHRAEWPAAPGRPGARIDATPAAAVYAGCLGAFGRPPDVVASGINPGANTGHLVLHSGTVGAALTAAGARRSRRSRSACVGRDRYHWETAAALADRGRRGPGGRRAPTRRPRRGSST